jgi:hypothetical protein
MQSVSITTKIVSLNPIHVIKFVSDLWQVSGFLWLSSINITDHHDITEILLSDIKHHNPNSIKVKISQLVLNIHSPNIKNDDRLMLNANISSILAILWHY